MQISANVRFFDVIAFFIDSLTRELSALKILGTAATLLVAILTQAYIRGGLDAVTQTAIGTGMVAVCCAVLFYGGITLMALAKRDENQPTGPVAYEVSDKGVSLRTTENFHQYPWDQITTIGHSENFVWFQVDDRHYRFIPRRSLASDEQFSEFWRALENSRLAA